MAFLHIAEKNSIAKQVANILSDGTKKPGFTRSPFNPVYEFTLQGHFQRFSSVRGHLFDFQLPVECKSWSNYDNKKILTKHVQIVKKPGLDMENIFLNLEELAKKSKHLILWLDCDREGEAIAYEVIQICQASNPNLTIHRARFSAVTKQDILHAYNNLVLPNQKEADAVKYRMEIDFRLGCTFTRFQTLVYRQRFFSGENKVLSYGPCQLPTLGFVVERYLEIKYFKSEDYFFLEATCVIDSQTGVDLKWKKKNTKNELAILLIYKKMYEKLRGNLKGKVIKSTKTTKKRYRPFPLTTVQLQKLATDKLRLTSARVMQIAERLYTNGYISYPRTETNSFPKTINLKNLVDRLRQNREYETYVERLIDKQQFENPKMGKSDDQAHSPIHPVKNAARDQLAPDQWRVYDLISRHFLACCSKDANNQFAGSLIIIEDYSIKTKNEKEFCSFMNLELNPIIIGEQYQTLVDIAGEQFKASYLTIRQRNFLDVYPFVKWSNSSLAAEIPQEFDAIVKIGKDKTKPPQFLSQSNLIQIMEKNNIGTDSTIHQHIQTIQKRNYAVKNNNTFKPTSLGASLIIAYRNLGMKIADCDVRRMMERNMDNIVRGYLMRERALQETLKFMIPIYEELIRRSQNWLDQITWAMEEHNNLVSLLQPDTQSLNANSNSISNIRSQAVLPKNRSNQANNDNIKNSSSNLNNVTCYRCNAIGHYANDCPKDKEGKLNWGQSIQNIPSSFHKPQNYLSDILCFRCNQKGHFAPNCPNLGRNGRKKKGYLQIKSQQKNNYKFKPNQTKILNYGFGQANQFNKSDFWDQNEEQNKIKQKKAKICKQCGIEGKHSNSSDCPKLKKNRSLVDFL